MYRFVLFAFLFALTACTPHSEEEAIQTALTGQDAESVALFNGIDFSGWTYFLADSTATMEDVWSVDSDTGILRCKGEPWGYLRTVDQYEDYILDLDWRWNPETREAGNSGVFLRVTGPDMQWPKCIEAQLFSGSAGDFVLMNGMEMDTDPARIHSEKSHLRLRSASAENPVGEWNHYQIRIQDGAITVNVNGQEVNQGSNIPPGPGYIALQSEGGDVQFRNIQLTPLN